MALSYETLNAYIDGLYGDGVLTTQEYNDIILYILANGEISTSARDLIQVRRGNLADLPVLAQGEIGFTLDEENMYVGGINGNVDIGNKELINQHSAQLAGIAIQVDMFRTPEISDNQAIKDTVTYANENGYKTILFSSKIPYILTSNLIFNSEVSGMTFIGNGSVVDTTNIPQSKPPKILFENCNDVNFYGFELIGNSHGDGSAIFSFWIDTERCKAYDNTIRGLSFTEQADHGISFYSMNGECYRNYVKWCSGFGIIIINDVTKDGAIRIHHNIVEECGRHIEPAYTAKNVTIDHNISINPQGEYSNHITVWAKDQDSQSGGVGFIENIEIFNNKFYGGRDGVWLTLGAYTSNTGDYIKNVNIHHNEFIGVGRGFYCSDNNGNLYENIKFNNNYVEVDRDFEGSLCQFSTGASNLKDITIESNTLVCKTDTKMAINIYRSADTIIDNAYVNNNTLRNVGSALTTRISYVLADYVEFKGNRILDKNNYNYADIEIPSTAEAYILNNKGLTSIGGTIGNNFVIKDNADYKTLDKGTVIIPSTQLTILVEPILALKAKRENIRVTPLTDLGEASYFYVGTVMTNGSFYIFLNILPTIDVMFSWYIDNSQ